MKSLKYAYEPNLKKNTLKKLCLPLCIICAFALFQCQEKRAYLGKEHAKKFLHSVRASLQIPPLQDSVFVKEEKIALQIAQSVLFERYGEGNITKQQPYEIYEIDNSWVIFGTLPEGTLGGTFQMAIDKKNGRIIGLTHGK